MNKTKNILRIAIVAALYVVITIINPFSYDAIQFRISEILILLCFYRKDYCYSLIIGCFIANLFSPMLLFDILFGTLATVISVLLVTNSKNIIVASIYPPIINGIIVGLELNLVLKEPLFISMGWVFLGEMIVVSIVGVLIFKILEKNDYFIQLIEANQNIKKMEC